MVALGLPLGVFATFGVIATGPMAGLALIAGALALVGVIYRPGALFAAYLLIAFYKGALQAYSPVDITVVLASLNALQIVPLIMDRRPRDISRAGTALWIALAVLIIGGVLYAPDQDLALRHAESYWALVLLPILPAALRVGSDPRYVREFLWAFFGMGALIVALGLLQLSSTDRLVVLGMNTIQVSRGALLVPILGVTFVLWERVRFARTMTIVLIPAAVIVAIASGSRGPLLVGVALAGLGAIRSVVRPRTLNWRLAAGIAGLALASIVVVSIAAPNLPLLSIERFASFGDFVQGGLSGANAQATDTSSAARTKLFGLAVSLFDQQPVLGVGTAGFEALSPRLLGPIDGLPYPHDAVLQFAAEFGLIGVALFMSLILIALRRRLPRGRYAPALRVLFLFFLLNAMVSGDIFSDRETWGLLMLVLLADASRVPEGWGSTVSVVGSGAPAPPTAQPLAVLGADRPESSVV